MTDYDHRNCQSLFGYAAKVHERSGGICQLCGAGMGGLHFDLWRQMTVEHLIGESQGGYLAQITASVARRFPDLGPAERTELARTIDEKNTVTACSFCNSTTSRSQSESRMDRLIEDSPGKTAEQVLAAVTAVLKDVLDDKRRNVKWKLESVRREYELRVLPSLEEAQANQGFDAPVPAVADSDVRLIVDRIISDVAVPPARFVEPPGYGHLSLALVDAVFSIQARYSSVKRVVAAYATVAGIGVDPLAARRNAAFRENGLDQFLDAADGLHGEELADKLFAGNRSRTAGRLKADVCIEVAHRLRDVSVTDIAELRRRAGDSEVSRAWTGVHGLGWVTWQYVCSLAGVDHFKPDILLTRFVSQTLHRPTSPAETDALLSRAFLVIQAEHPALDKRTLDHTIWRFQRKLP